MNLNMIVSFLSNMFEGQLIICWYIQICLKDNLLFATFFADDGGNNAYGVKEEMKKLDIFASEEEKEATHSQTQSNVVEWYLLRFSFYEL